MHGNADGSDSDIEPDTIAPTPPPAEVSTLLAARPVSETVPGQSPGRRELTEPIVAPPAASPEGCVPSSRASRLKELQAARLARQAQSRLRKEQLGLPPSDDECRPTYRPTPERLRELHEKRRVRLEQERLKQEREAKELEAMERELMERETQATSGATTGGEAPPAPVAECPPLGNSQLSACSANGPTELEIALATPDLSPEQKKFLAQKRFQHTTKMVPSDILTTARQVFYSHYIRATDIVAGITAQRTGARHTHMVPKANSTTSGPCWTKNLPKYI